MAKATSRPWRIAQPPGGLAWSVVGVTFVSLAAGLPLGHVSPAYSTNSIVTPNAAAVPATLTLGTSFGSHGSDPFYAVVFTPTGYGHRASTALGLFFNSTPFTWFRVSDGGEGYDPTTGIDWVAPASGGAYQPLLTQNLNFTWFKAWCNSRTPHCNWIGTLPAEENNTALAVHTATWFHQVLGFAPTAWQFGNEPNAWTHYGKNLSSWATTDNHAPSGWDYATMVKNYIAAVSALFPTDRYIGIESNCACGKSLIPTTAQVDGGKVMAMAYHEYPWLPGSGTSVGPFMGSLNASTAIPASAAKMRTLDGTNCSCSNIPIEVGEYQAGIFNNHSPLAHTYDGVPFITASVIEALESNVSMFTEYELGDLYNTTTGAVLPEGMAYQRLLDNFTMGQDFTVSVNAPGVSGVYALLTQNGTHTSLLVVNTNTTQSITFTLSSAFFALGALGMHYGWTNGALTPKATFGTLPRTTTLSPLTIVLLTT